MDMVAVSSAASVIDWSGFAQDSASVLLPDVVKILFNLILIPLIGMAGRAAAHHFAQMHFKFLVKWSAQKVERGTEEWAKKRSTLVVEAAKGTWWLKWLSQDQIDQLIEAAVAEWNKEFYQALGEKP